ncbi:TonB family protein [Martelella alba]|uniref:TonB family protein n=1 Tax=Martelella alba TaxID=2590451 RepID=A0A506U9I7_9HYPH|nr:TonB family protein [Martelella alba]TPW30540.1 TonB family protein [Martelella alba]
MDFDRSTFANGLPGGVRERQSGGPDPSSALEAGTEGERASDADGLLDEAVFALIASARGSGSDAGDASDTVGEDTTAALEEAPQDIDPPSLPRIVPLASRLPARGTVVFVLASVIFHSMLLAMALNIVRSIPEAPVEAGSISVSVVMLGDGNIDASAAGGEDEIVNPVAVEAKPVQTAEISPEPVPETVAPIETPAPEMPQIPEPAISPPLMSEPVTPDVATVEPVTDAAAAAVLPATEPVQPVTTPAAVEPAPVEPVAVTEAAPELAPLVPDVLAVAPSVAAPDDAVPPAPAPAPPPQPKTATAETPAAEPTKPVETEVLQPVQPAEAAAITAEVPDDVAMADALPLPDAPPTPTPSPRKNAPEPQKRVTKPTRQAAQPKPQTASRGNGGQAEADARRGVATGEKNGKAADAARQSADASGAGQAARSNYEGRIQRRLARAISPSRYYSRIGEQLKATVALRIVLDRSGRVDSIRLTRGSGNSEIDGIVLQRAGRAGPFPAFPTGAYSGNSKGFTMSVNLDLR